MSEARIADRPTDRPTSTTDRGLAFAALQSPDYRWYLISTTLWMMGDNIEHVISYWALFQTFHSPMLGGFAVVSHWLPFLILSVYFGGLADRFDCRKIILVSQVMFMLVSAAWGVLFLTGTLQVWHALVLLSIHGLAGVVQGPANQLVIHDIVGRERLQSAVRIAATGRNLGVLLGPALGGGLLVLLGPGLGLFANVLIYLPLTIWALTAPYTGHLRQAAAPAGPSRWFGFDQTIFAIRAVSGNRTIVTMVVLAGGTSFLVGNASRRRCLSSPAISVPMSRAWATAPC